MAAVVNVKGPKPTTPPPIKQITQIQTYGALDSIPSMPSMPSLFPVTISPTQVQGPPQPQQPQIHFAEPLHMPEINKKPTKTYDIAFGTYKKDRVTTLIPFLSTKSNLIHTTDNIHTRRKTSIFGHTFSREEVKLRNAQYHFLAPRLVPTKHLHPLTTPTDPASDFHARDASKKDPWSHDSTEVGAAQRLGLWVDRARNGGVPSTECIETAVPTTVTAGTGTTTTPSSIVVKSGGRVAREWGGIGVGLGDPRIAENAFCEDKRITCVVSSHRWNGGGDVRLASDGTLLYKIHRKSIGTKQSLVLCDARGRKIWKLAERTGLTGFNYDLYRFVHDSSSSSSSSEQDTMTTTSTRVKPGPSGKSNTSTKQKWYLIGTLDRVCPSSSTGQANSLYGSLSNKCVHKPPTMNLKHDNFCGRVGAGGIYGIASPTGCVGDSMIMPFTRLLMKWNGWGTHILHAPNHKTHSTTTEHHQKRYTDVYSSEASNSEWETDRDGVSSAIMMGNPGQHSYRFLDQKTSRHAGTFLKMQERQESKVMNRNSNTFEERDGPEPTLDRWELVIEPPLGLTADKGKSENMKCVRRSMPPEMMLAAGLVAQMMVDRKPEGRLVGSRGLVESEMGKGLGRRVKSLLPNVIANDSRKAAIDIQTIVS
ncbi:hypothetical protein HDU99_004478 [Rhizoclosmatium hyalinum]|nr:hypothetical protein HDU99_004478 [Rhizoclosmatium hyalinum]